MKLPDIAPRPAAQLSLPALFSHLINVAVPVLYVIVFTTPVIGMIAAIEPVV